MKLNAPYFPYTAPSIKEFEEGIFKRLLEGKSALLILVDGVVIGSVTYYWEDKNTRWLEIGIVICSDKKWGKGLGGQALQIWISHLFETLKIERVGLTTWSGNPRMIACAKSIGMKIEAQLRKVRYYNGVYYDSVKLGILREEWANNDKQSSL